MSLNDDLQRIDKRFSEVLKEFRDQKGFDSIRETTGYLAKPMEDLMKDLKDPEDEEDPIEELGKRLMEI